MEGHSQKNLREQKLCGTESTFKAEFHWNAEATEWAVSSAKIIPDW